MQSQLYQAQDLIALLEAQIKQNFSGVVSLKTQVDSWQNQRTSILILNHGAIVYGGVKVPTNQELAKSLGKKFKPDLINAALEVALTKLVNPDSVGELMEKLIKIKVFTWANIEQFIERQVVAILEKFSLHPGIAEWQNNTEFDLNFGKNYHGLDWSKIQQQLSQRQEKWVELAPTIPALDAIPLITPDTLKQVKDLRVKEHLLKFIDGRRALVDIAEAMDKDPLTVAKSYYPWVMSGWVSFEYDRETQNNTQSVVTPLNSTAAINSSPPSTQSLPIILSVDDSPIVQTSIKRALSDRYQVLLAGKATEALSILNQKPVKLLLLDLTMPDIDGLEFCKTIRQIPQFRNLPIVMVTARDGLINKMKGHIAGTSKYLTKPFQAEELQAIVAEFVSPGNT
ncbi:MAG: PleD family two-component system response regulator [Pleurocapsa sp.]